MTFEVRLDRHASRALDALDRGIRTRLVAGMRALKQDPLRPRPGADIKRLQARPGVFRLRIGEYRVFYVAYPEQGVVVVTDVRHRSHAYD